MNTSGWYIRASSAMAWCPGPKQPVFFSRKIVINVDYKNRKIAYKLIYLILIIWHTNISYTDNSPFIIKQQNWLDTYHQYYCCQSLPKFKLKSSILRAYSVKCQRRSRSWTIKISLFISIDIWYLTNNTLFHKLP